MLKRPTRGDLHIIFEVEFPSVVPVLEDYERDILKRIVGLPVDDELLNQKILQKAKNITSPPKPKPRTKASQYDPNRMDVDEEAAPMEMDVLSPQPIYTETTSKGEKKKKDIIFDECNLDDIDHSARVRSNGATMVDEDEAGMPAGGERVQCATQ